jgi:hypothetical protein
VVAIHHTVKKIAHTGHPLQAIGGSGGGLGGAARAVYVFGSNPHDSTERVLAPCKFNLGPMPKSVLFEMDDHEFMIGSGQEAQLIHTGRLLVVSQKSKVTATQVLLAGAGFVIGHKPQTKIEESAGWLTLYLSWGPQPVENIHEDANQVGHRWMTVRRSSEEIGIEIRRRGGGVGSYSEWALPIGHPALLVKQCATCLHDENDHLDSGCQKPMCDCGKYKESV